MTITDMPAGWLPLVDSVVKATIVLGGAAVAAYALRHASAALRHLIWTVALTSALLMPVLSIALPRWQLPVVTLAAPVTPAPIAPIDDAASQAPPFRANEPERGPSAATMPASSGAAAAPVAPGPAAAGIGDISWPRALAGVWAIGVLLIVGRVLVGLVAVQWMARRGERVLDAPWMKMAIGLASEVGVPSNITFLRSGRAVMPMACGVLRPAVMMPAEADEWPHDRLRIVLLHELAHVKRRDCLTHLLAQIACAFHWFNPLAWVAARHVRTERERACDDLVLAAGTDGPDYADQLLEIARVMRSGRYPAVLAGASLAMAHRSQLEGRLMAILDPRVPHSAMTRLRAAVAVAACCAAIVPLASLQAWDHAVPAIADGSTDRSTLPPAAQVPARPEAVNPAPSPQPSPVRVRERDRDHDAEEASAEIAGVIADAKSVGMAAATAAVGATVGTVVGALTGAGVQDAAEIAEEALREHDVQDTKTGSSKADPRMIAALTAALKDTDKEVRETAMHALVQMRDPSVFEPLVQALKDVSPDVREQAAFGLGQLRDRRAVDPLAVALKDEHAEVREKAAFALSQIRDRTAIPALTAALKDADADVREQALFALSQFRDPATIDAFVIALRDSNADVREKAAFSLGQLRDRRGVEPLISALKDTDADVREQAAFGLGQVRDRSAVEALVIALKDTSASVREQSAFALGQLRDPRAIEGLTTALKDPQASVRQQAAFALGQLAR
jgi:HEAT repeat protein/beta-lactamase regulating signal transducer with metallopeptidase domain